MPYVLRVETKEGRGCYAAGFYTDYADPESLNWPENYRPIPNNDPEIGMDKKHIFQEAGFYGFLDMHQLKSWFSPEDLKRLKCRLGCRLRVYQVSAESDILLGKTQVIFYKPVSVRIADLDLEEI